MNHHLYQHHHLHHLFLHLILFLFLLLFPTYPGLFFLSDCGGFFYSPTGIIESPEWPKHYKGKTLCTWHVAVDPSDKIVLRFNSFGLKENGTCTKAKLVVRDGNSEDANVLGVYCGNKRPPELTSSRNHLWLQFTSVEGAEGKGFLIHYDTGY